jgi:aminopeptidase N
MTTGDAAATATDTRPDPHSHARPDDVVVRHVELDLEADFDAQRLAGSATVTIENLTGADTLILDVNDLEIRSVTLFPSNRPADYALSPDDPILGSALRIAVLPATEKIRIDYATSPDAPALQWLSPSQTTSGKPFLFSQSQAILARSWVPIQDSPGVRFTYDARLRVPPGLMAVMSAENAREKSPAGVYTFSMPQAIPSYLMAIAVGDLDFRELGPRSGVYAEPSVVDAAAWEFAEVEDMLDAAEALYGPYLWGRYDLLVLPPSFPYGGMENPRLTYVTPTLLAGDRSLVNVVAHEIAHSWSGNLVTNATWNDFWLNEGFTTYVELRIMEAIRGTDYAEMLWGLSLNDLENEFERLGADSEKTQLYLDVSGDNPDDGLIIVAYEKGAAFLRRLEHYVGRERWDDFLIGYFGAHAFESIDTVAFVAYLRENLLNEAFPGPAPSLDAWVYGPGLPDDYVRPESGAFAAVGAQLGEWLGGAAAADIDAAGWSTQEWLQFLNELPAVLSYEQLAELDSAFGLTESGNAEIRSAWYKVAIRNHYAPAYAALEEFLVAVGRRKFLQPLYTALAADEDGLAFARRVYATARPGYHAVSAETIDRILDREP